MTETWKPIPRYEGLYEVSDLGRVQGVPRTLPDGRHWKGRIMKPIRQNQGYLICVLSKDGHGTQHLIHRLVIAAFTGQATIHAYNIHHKNKDRTDNRLDNLECLLTGAHNGLHYASRKPCRGESIGSSKLTEKDILAIRAAHATGRFFHRELARLFDVHESHISRIINNKYWTHL